MVLKFRRLAALVFLLSGFAVSARAWDWSKPFIYEMKIAFETDNWINMYSTATVLSKSGNTEAFRVVANSTTTPTYQLLVTTQGYVGIATASPAGLFTVGNGTMVVTSAGNVGIGTASPSDALAVSGDISATGAFKLQMVQVTGTCSLSGVANTTCWASAGCPSGYYIIGGGARIQPPCSWEDGTAIKKSAPDGNATWACQFININSGCGSGYSQTQTCYALCAKIAAY